MLNFSKPYFLPPLTNKLVLIVYSLSKSVNSIDFNGSQSINLKSLKDSGLRTVKLFQQWFLKGVNTLKGVLSFLKVELSKIL